MFDFIVHTLQASKGFLIEQGVNLLTKLVDGQIHNDDVRALGVKCGKAVTDHAREKLGGSWDAVEDVVQEKADMFLDGFKEGLNYDDK